MTQALIAAHQDSLQRIVTGLNQFSELVEALNSTLHTELQAAIDRTNYAMANPNGAPPQQTPPAPAGFGQMPNLGTYVPPGQHAGMPPPMVSQQPQYAPPPQQAAPSFPAPTGNAPAAAPDAAKKKRRTKIEIAADEAAIAAGYQSDAHMRQVLGGSGAPAAGQGQGPAAMQPPAMATGTPPMGQVPNVQPQVPAAPPVQTGPTVEDVVAGFQRVIGFIEAIPGWAGHGQGQAGALLAKKFPGVNNVYDLPPEQRPVAIQWCDFFIQEFTAGRLPGGVATVDF